MTVTAETVAWFWMAVWSTVAVGGILLCAFLGWLLLRPDRSQAFTVLPPEHRTRRAETSDVADHQQRSDRVTPSGTPSAKP